MNSGDSMDEMVIHLWDWALDDESAWQALTGDAMTHREYQTVIAGVQADQEQQGRTVNRVRMTVAEMKAELSARGLPNDPVGRATVIASRG